MTGTGPSLAYLSSNSQANESLIIICNKIYTKYYLTIPYGHNHLLEEAGLYKNFTSLFTVEAKRTSWEVPRNFPGTSLFTVEANFLGTSQELRFSQSKGTFWELRFSQSKRTSWELRFSQHASGTSCELPRNFPGSFPGTSLFTVEANFPGSLPTCCAKFRKFPKSSLKPRI